MLSRKIINVNNDLARKYGNVKVKDFRKSVNKDDAEKGGQLIESNREELAKENRLQQSNKYKQFRTRYIAHLTKQISTVSDLMLDYSNELQTRKW